MGVDIRTIEKPQKFAVFIPTNLPTEDPRDVSDRALSRFRIGAELVQQLREEHGRANVLLVLFGGWPLHNRLPLAIHHAYAAMRMHSIFEVEDFDLIFSYGVNTVTDLHGTLSWMKQNLLNVESAYVVTSTGHAQRLVAESDMYSLFKEVKHVESHEHRSAQEDIDWTERAKNIPPHQFLVGGRASDVTRFGSQDSLEYANKMGEWAENHPHEFKEYMSNIWDLVEELEAANVVVRSNTPGCWRININC